MREDEWTDWSVGERATVRGCEDKRHEQSEFARPDPTARAGLGVAVSGK